MTEIEKYIDLNLEAGRLCLDFANTSNWHASDRPIEELKSYADLILWAQQVSVLTEGKAKLLFRKAINHPIEAAAVLEQAIILREAIYRIFSAVAASRVLEADDLSTLNATLPEALARLKIVQTANGFIWGWSGDGNELDQMLWPVIRSAVDLLTAEELNRVGECADDRGCGYLFFDISRNRSRRWCDMRDCGNRAKARRHYKRHYADETARR